MGTKKYTSEEWYSWPYNFENNIPIPECEPCPYCGKENCEPYDEKQNAWINPIPSKELPENCYNCGWEGKNKELVYGGIEQSSSFSDQKVEAWKCPNCNLTIMWRGRYNNYK